MKRLNCNGLVKIKEYRKKGYSYNEIAKKFRLPKSTVQYNTSSIKLDKGAKDRINQKIIKNRRKFARIYARKISKDELCKLRALRRKKYTLSQISNQTGLSLDCVKEYLKGMPIKPIPSIPEKLGFRQTRIIAHCIFDGHVMQNKYKFGYTNKSKGLIDQFASDVNTVYRLIPHFYKDKESCYYVNFYSKAVMKHLTQYTSTYSTASSDLPTQIPLEILDSNNRIKKIFLRAFWDDEGSVLFGLHKRALIGACYHDNVLKGLARLHQDLGIECKLDTKRHIIALYKKSEIMKFKSNINFSKEAFVTRGKWIGFTKQEILDKVISSFTEPKFSNA